MAAHQVNAYNVIARKRDGAVHSAAEIEWLIAGFVDGRIPDYQMAAWLMAAYLRGLNESEMLALTAAMTASGRVIDLAGLPRPIVDKHSTGGVGDKTTLVVAPLVAACGLPVAPLTVDVAAPHGGIVQRVDALALGILARDLGAGRATKTDVIDPAVGMVVHRKAGDPVRAGDVLATLHLARPDGREDLAARCAATVTIGDTP